MMADPADVEVRFEKVLERIVEIEAELLDKSAEACKVAFEAFETRGRSWFREIGTGRRVS